MGCCAGVCCVPSSVATVKTTATTKIATMESGPRGLIAAVSEWKGNPSR
jgi:hypothetical protein